MHYASSISRSAGGLFYSVSGLANAQQRAGHYVAVCGGADEFMDADASRWEVSKLIQHDLRFGRYGLSLSALSAIWAMEPDVLHIHGIWSAASIYGRFAQMLRIPVVLSPHGMLDPWIVARHSNLKRAHAALLERPLLRAAAIHALNDSEKQAVCEFDAKCEAQTFVLPNGVEPPGDVNLKAPRSGGVFLGRLHPKKQVLELIDHWERACAGQRLKVAGWGDPIYEAQVERRCAAAHNVEFVGAAYGAAKDRLLQSARVFVLPSLSEGLPMAVLEAMAAGAIPVITGSCNLTELIASDHAFRIAEDFSDFDLVLADVLGRSEEEFARRAIGCVERARGYDWAAIAADMVAHYDAVIAR